MAVLTYVAQNVVILMTNRKQEKKINKGKDTTNPKNRWNKAVQHYNKIRETLKRQKRLLKLLSLKQKRKQKKLDDIYGKE